MMPSNLLSRLLPDPSHSIYETLRQTDDAESLDLEQGGGAIALDEHNLAQSRLDLDPDQFDRAEGHIRLGSPISTRTKSSSNASKAPARKHKKSKSRELEDSDDDVPPSLLLEVARDGRPILQPQSPPPMPYSDNIPGNVTDITRAQWNTTQKRQALYPGSPVSPAHTGRSSAVPKRTTFIIDPRERALWNWSNVQNLDNFLHDVYVYYQGKGIYAAVLKSLLDLLKSAFVVGITIFLTSCVNYGKVKEGKELSDILVPHCTAQMSGWTNFMIWVFSFIWLWQLVELIRSIPRLRRLHDFYHYLLEVPDTDIQTVQWQEIVKKLMVLREHNPTTVTKLNDRQRAFIGTQTRQRMDAHDIANRIMRRDNYMIAMINKEILDLNITIPFIGTRSVYSRLVEFYLNLAIMDFVFDKHGQPAKEFLKDGSRQELSEALRRRFYGFSALSLLALVPTGFFAAVFWVFRNFSEFQKNPASITARQYTRHAEWKFREFNELPHMFDRRALMSYPFAARYIEQFPKYKTDVVLSFFNFIAGALLAVLAGISVIDSESFLSIEITPGRSVLVYLTVLGIIWGATRNSKVVGGEENMIFDPEYALAAVIRFTHYMPSHWKGKLHSDEVRREFAQLYQVKTVTAFQELFNLLITPFVLWYNLPKCSERIVDFFREFTIHVDGLGYVCSFAVFDFENGGDKARRGKAALPGGDADPREDYYSTKDGKMMASYFNFMDNYTNNQATGARTVSNPQMQSQSGPLASILEDGQPLILGRTDTWDGRQGSARGIQPPRAPRFAPVRPHQSSPLASILLDPSHHQSQRANRRSPQSRLRYPRNDFGELIEDNAVAAEPVQRSPALSPDRDPDGQDQSWKMSGAADVEDTNLAGPSSRKKSKAGVLGLVYEFSKAQTGARGSGVDI